MPAILTPETGSGNPAANTYATRDQANDYHDARLHSETWDGATDATKDKALLTATRHLDANTEWIGQRETLEQGLAWPRVRVEWQGFHPPPGWIPPPVIAATCELARLIIENDLLAEQSGDNIKEIGLGDRAVQIIFKDGSKTRRMPWVISEILQGVGATVQSGGLNSRKVAAR